MENQNLIHQIFIGKVAEVLGVEKTTNLLKEALLVFPKSTHMKFKDAPLGARFRFINKDIPGVFVKIHDYDKGLIVKWNGNTTGHQSHTHWLDEKNGYDFDTVIDVI